jgi:hypothetical protein
MTGCPNQKGPNPSPYSWVTLGIIVAGAVRVSASNHRFTWPRMWPSELLNNLATKLTTSRLVCPSSREVVSLVVVNEVHERSKRTTSSYDSVSHIIPFSLSLSSTSFSSTSISSLLLFFFCIKFYDFLKLLFFSFIVIEKKQSNPTLERIRIESNEK